MQMTLLIMVPPLSFQVSSYYLHENKSYNNKRGAMVIQKGVVLDMKMFGNPEKSALFPSAV